MVAVLLHLVFISAGNWSEMYVFPENWEHIISLNAKHLRPLSLLCASEEWPSALVSTCECSGSTAVKSARVLINWTIEGKALDSSSGQWMHCSLCTIWMPKRNNFFTALFLRRKGGYCSVSPIRCWSLTPFVGVLKDSGLVLTRWAMAPSANKLNLTSPQFVFGLKQK